MSKCAQSDLPGAYPIVSSKLSKMVVNFSSYPHLSPMSLLEWKPLHVDYIGGGFLQHYVLFFIFFFLFDLRQQTMSSCRVGIFWKKKACGPSLCACLPATVAVLICPRILHIQGNITPTNTCTRILNQKNFTQAKTAS